MKVPLETGFTLIEVLIALSLLSVMMLMLFAGLRIGAKSWDKGDEKLTQINDISSVHNFFHNQLSAALPVWDDFTEKDKQFSFQGTQQRLQFVTALPASSKRQGLQYFTLQLKDHQLSVSIKPFYPAFENESWKPEELVLVDHIHSLALAYFGKETGKTEEKWQTEWTEAHLPQLIRIKIIPLKANHWPQITLKLNNEAHQLPKKNLFAKALKDLKRKQEVRDIEASNPF